MNKQLLGIDWGTSNRRAYLVDASGACLRRHADDQGMLACAGRFPQALAALLAEMGIDDATPVVISGMAGSAQGWQEAPYLDGAVALADLGSHLVPVQGAGRAGPTAIVPGYCMRGPLLDVMRGEETQLLGVLLLRQPDGWVVLPGTHSKWVLLEAGRIVRWSTFMTGELFSALAAGGTLAPLINHANAPDDGVGFEAGLALARARLPLSQALFSIRARVVTGLLEPALARSCVSGLLIGVEFDACAEQGAGAAPLALLGSSQLCQRYGEAARYFGRTVTMLDPDAAYCAALGHFLRREALE